MPQEPDVPVAPPAPEAGPRPDPPIGEVDKDSLKPQRDLRQEDEAAHELDPEILRELQESLHRRTEATVGGEPSQSGDEVSLEREMSKLLNNISTDQKR